ncbi:hypothetical protein V6C66_11285 [Lacticaseibacillus paracasei]|uniref:hypothetical protein n=1 Tax=Lacticaseibacillus paracasei TaxID=1597 RepID=UPI002FD8AC51
MDKATELRLGIKSMLSQYDHYFTRAPHTRYWLVVVNNHFEDCYSIFILNFQVKCNDDNEFLIVV